MFIVWQGAPGTAETAHGWGVIAMGVMKPPVTQHAAA
jgi:hypothetical protein